MKFLTSFALIAFLPFLSGCFSMKATQAANKHIVQTTLYDSADAIEKAAITKDNQLCVFFVKFPTNSKPSRFTLFIPLAQMRTNAQMQPAFAAAGILHSTNNYDLYLKLPPAVERAMFPESKLPADKTNALFVKCVITSATMNVPGSTICTNLTLLENGQNFLKFIPVGAPLNLGRYENALYHGLDLPLLSNAMETVYLTKTNPIEFTYIDASIKRSMTIITIDPYVISTEHTDHPGYYFLLPLTVPVDIVTSPFQVIYYGWMYLVFSGLGRNC